MSRWKYIISFVIVAVAVFFGVQYFTKTGIFRIPGVVYYDESLTEDEVALFARATDWKQSKCPATSE